MFDCIDVVVGAAMFVVALIYVRGCELLKGSRS